MKGTCNIDKTDRINRAIIGILLLIGVLLGAGSLFYTIIGAALILEGVIGWCSIPVILSKFKSKKS